ncbi:MAG: hypothetical protein KDD41_11880 [Flavobacteriales bacterium]|nr:hypothetical protein [Flavobacteriales bacterium]
MKKIYFLGILSLIFSATAFSQSDNVQNPITDEERLLEATIVCLDALEAPTKYNEFAKPFISMPGFPQPSPSLSHDDLRNQINAYFVTHPELIDQVRKERKIAHDQLYGPRPY